MCSGDSRPPTPTARCHYPNGSRPANPSAPATHDDMCSWDTMGCGDTAPATTWVARALGGKGTKATVGGPRTRRGEHSQAQRSRARARGLCRRWPPRRRAREPRRPEDRAPSRRARHGRQPRRARHRCPASAAPRPSPTSGSPSPSGRRRGPQSAYAWPAPARPRRAAGGPPQTAAPRRGSGVRLGPLGPGIVKLLCS